MIPYQYLCLPNIFCLFVTDQYFSLHCDIVIKRNHVQNIYFDIIIILHLFQDEREKKVKV